ncbi:MAG: acetyl-CoA acetyltransferase, partial [Myxococcota bacterium]|nr:acetyl-CoA acetyltransferase [Myxococcota bacterium]
NAAADSGAGAGVAGVLEAADTLGVVGLIGTRSTNPPEGLALELGIAPRRKVMTRVGGEMPLVLVNELASCIAAGQSEVALVLGVNPLASMMKARKTGVDLDWLDRGEGEPELMGTTEPGAHPREVQHGLAMPPQIYPLLEHALRGRRGLSLEAHAANLGALMAPFTRVAAANPYSWFPVERSAEELITPTADNRMVGHPYTKYLNAVLYTDQAAGVILASEAAADRLGVPEEKRVRWWGGAQANERAWFVSERPEIGDAPAMRACATRTLDAAGVSIDDVDHMDLYSCFPVAVEMGCEAFGVAEDDPRGLTTTGGLPYHGGPGNNYTLHGLATVAERCRANPGSVGLATGNGWYLTKHSANVWSTRPRPGDSPPRADASELSVGPEPIPVEEAPEGEGRVESYTVIYGRDGQPELGIVLGRLLDGDQRFIANLAGDPAAMEAFAQGDALGRTGRVEPGDERNLFHPG